MVFLATVIYDLAVFQYFKAILFEPQGVEGYHGENSGVRWQIDQSFETPSRP